MICKNIFITGPIRCGKSTLISEAISGSDLPAGGCFVQRLMKGKLTRAFRLADLSQEPYIPDLEMGDEQLNAKDIIIHFENGMGCFPDVFETIGTAIIKQSLAERTLLVLDELGRVELKAPLFMQAVFAALDSLQPVIGVLKKEHNIFLDRIRSRSDVKVLDLERIPYEEVVLEVKNFIETFTRERGAVVRIN